jgi:hypothetical protein
MAPCADLRCLMAGRCETWPVGARATLAQAAGDRRARYTPPMPRTPAIIVGLDCIQGFQSARGFARRGVPGVGVAKDRRRYARRTNACDRILVTDTGGPVLINLLERIGTGSRTGQSWCPPRTRTCLYCRGRASGSGGGTGSRYLEMKRDAASGDYLIIEPTISRPTGRAALAEGSGAELLYTMSCDMVGRAPPEARTQEFRGVEWVHPLRVLHASAHHRRRGELTFRDWWRSIRGPKVFAIVLRRDPRPFLAALSYALPVAGSSRQRQPELD